MQKKTFCLLICVFLILLNACSEKKAPQSSAEKKAKLKLILINKAKDGNYYTDTRTQAQVFAPLGFELDIENSFTAWGENFQIKSKDDFKIFLRFDAAKEDDQEKICKATLFEGPLANLDSSKLKLFPFLKGEFNADMIVTTDKVYPLKEDPNSPQKANLFQIRKKNLGCYTFLFIYGNAESLAQHSTEKEILEYVRFE